MSLPPWMLLAARRAAAGWARRYLLPTVALLGTMVGLLALTLVPAVPAPPPSLLGAPASMALACSAGLAHDPDDFEGAALALAAARSAGWTGEDLRTAVMVAGAESSFDPRAGNRLRDGRTHQGLWQISSLHTDLIAEHGGDRYDPAANAAMAHELWVRAGGWGPWEAYTSGAYLRHAGATDAALAADPGHAALPAASCTPATPPTLVVADAGDGLQGPDGLRPRAAAARETALATWGCSARPAPCVRTVGGYAKRTIAGTSTLSDHATGRAADVMIPDWSSPAGRALGQEVADHFVANGPALGVKYVIWFDRIHGLDERGWRPYRHPSGSQNPTLAHRDHVHISFA